MFSARASDTSRLEIAIKEMIYRTARKHKINLSSESIEGILIDLIEGVAERSGQVVVLVDEYYKPILDNIVNVEKAGEIREVLRSFYTYTALKSCDKYLRFVMLTGISKFSKVGVFSALNNLLDIPLVEKYSNIVGYTSGELEKYFGGVFLFENKMRCSYADVVL